MAVLWGNRSRIEKSDLCAGLEVWLASESSDSAVVAVDTWYWTQYWTDWSTCYYQVYGVSDDSAKFGIHVDKSSEIKLKRYQKSVPKRYQHQGGEYNFPVGFRVTIPHFGTDSTASGSITIPRKIYSAPPTPSNASAIKTSSSTATISWSVKSTDQNWDEWTYVWRKTDGGDYTQVARLNHGQTTFVDASLEPGHFYQYGIQTRNIDAWSDINHISNTIVTSLDAPLNVSATKTNATSVTISWEYGTKGQAGFDIDRSVNNEAFINIAHVGSGIRSYTDTSSPAGTVVYRIRSHSDDIQSEYTLSNKITTIAPPAAPTITTHPNQIIGVKLGATTANYTIGFLHNSKDGSGQQAAEIEVTKKNGTKNYQLKSQTTFTGTLDAGDISGSDIKVRVRTKGLHADFGDWSMPIIFKVRHLPEPLIDYPGTDAFIVRNIPLLASWKTKVDQSMPTSCSLKLFEGNVCVHEVELTGVTSSYRYGLDSYFLKNKTSYALELSVRDANGLTGHARREFTVDYYQPAPAQGVISYNNALASANISAFTGTAQQNNAETKSLAIYRIVNNKRTLLAQNLKNGATITDKFAPLGTNYAYEIVSLAENGASNTTTIKARMVTDACWAVNYGVGFNQVLPLMHNISEDISESISKELVSYAGRTYPVLYCDSHAKEQKISLSATVYEEQMSSVMMLAKYPGVCALRDVRGQLLPVSVSVSYSTSNQQMRSVKLECTVVDYGLE